MGGAIKSLARTRRAVRQPLEMGLQASSVSHITDNSIPSPVTRAAPIRTWSASSARVGILQLVILATAAAARARPDGVFGIC